MKWSVFLLSSSSRANYSAALIAPSKRKLSASEFFIHGQPSDAILTGPNVKSLIRLCFYFFHIFLPLTGAILSLTRMEKSLNHCSRLEVGTIANLILTMSSLPWWPSSLFQPLKAGLSEFWGLIHSYTRDVIWWNQKEMTFSIYKTSCVTSLRNASVLSQPFCKVSTENNRFHSWHLLKHS